MKKNSIILTLIFSVALICGCSKDEFAIKHWPRDIFTEITDPHFRQFCKSRFDFNGDGILSQYEALEAIAIIMDESSITGGITNCLSIDGIEYFQNLEYLNWYAVEPSEVDLSKNRKLKEIVFRNLTSLALGKQPHLQKIGCRKCTFNEIDISNCPELEWLDCADCKLTNICYGRKCKKLVWINCNNNDLETLSVNNLPKFGQLDCDRCKKLKHLDLSNNPSFGWLHCSYCKNLETINLNGTDLKELVCYGCNLSEIDVTDMTGLKVLYCGDNRLTTLDVSNCLQLEILSCEGNNISTLYLSEGQVIPDLRKDNTTEIIYK